MDKEARDYEAQSRLKFSNLQIAGAQQAGQIQCKELAAYLTAAAVTLKSMGDNFNIHSVLTELTFIEGMVRRVEDTLRFERGEIEKAVVTIKTLNALGYE